MSFSLTRIPITNTEWTALSAPAAATVASASVPSVQGLRRILDSLGFSISAIAAQGEIEIVLRDGLAGAGTILWQWGCALVVGTSVQKMFSNLQIVGSINTAMTLETTTAPAATNFARVNMSGALCQG